MTNISLSLTVSALRTLLVSGHISGRVEETGGAYVKLIDGTDQGFRMEVHATPSGVEVTLQGGSFAERTKVLEALNRLPKPQVQLPGGLVSGTDFRLGGTNQHYGFAKWTFRDAGIAYGQDAVEKAFDRAIIAIELFKHYKGSFAAACAHLGIFNGNSQPAVAA